MLTDTERQALHVAVCSCSDLSDECLVRMDYDPGGLGLAVETIVAAREGVWRAPIEALIPIERETGDDGAVHHESGFSHGLAFQCEYCPGYPHATCVRGVDLTAALGSVSAPGNETGQ